MPTIFKSEGKVDGLQKLTLETLPREGVSLSEQLCHEVGIAHTRWATHGPPSTVNSHPQLSDPSCEFVVVHNGIITNYAVLKEWLVNHGESFVSETDTEVIPKLIRFIYRRMSAKMSFPRLVTEALKKLQGAYAILVKSTHYPGELVACKRGSPMILGVSDGLRPGSPRGAAAARRWGDGAATGYGSGSMECWIASDASAGAIRAFGASLAYSAARLHS